MRIVARVTFWLLLAVVGFVSIAAGVSPRTALLRDFLAELKRRV